MGFGKLKRAVGGGALGGLFGTHGAAAGFGLGGGFKGLGFGGSKPPGFAGGNPLPDFAMRKTSEFERNNPNIQIGGPSGRRDLEQGIQKQFAGVKEIAGNKINAGLQGQANALQRRFSAMGASGSGAQIKALQQAHDAAAQAQSDAAMQIGSQEAETLTNALQNRDLAQADLDFKQRVFNFEQGSKLHELDLAERQQKIDAASTEYNRRLSEFQAQPPKQGLISNILGRVL